MSLDPVAAGALLLQQGASLAARLAPGQVVKAQVLHHYEGQRYLVRILGHDSVVDSASPLRPGESVQARVTRLGERVELERLAPDATTLDAPSAEAAGAAGGDLVDELFRRFRGRLEPAAAELLRRKVARAARPERMALAGLVLHKLELPVDHELLDATYEAMALRGDAREVAAAAAEPLAAALVPGVAAPGLRVLNAQAGGTVAHQAGAVALRAGAGELTVEIAVFEEGPQPGGREPRLRHRKLVLALEAPGLGRVEARAVTADAHLRVALATGTPEGTRALMRHGESLAQELAGDGWCVDEIAYETRERAGPGAALGALLEHLVTPGSVSRLA
jgi:hypothetical protein